ncbi:callose synthase 9, partial [Tanacetum coccineum]
MIKSMDDVHKSFKSFPEAFMDNLHINSARRDFLKEKAQVKDLEKEDAGRFSPFWNEIVNNLRQEDYITNEEQNVLLMPQSSQSMVQWPRFLSGDNVFLPTNLEARRRLEYFTNSLFMSMPKPEAVPKILAFSVFTPYYEETVLYSMVELLKVIGNGYTLLFNLQNTYPDEWRNFLARMDLDESTPVSYFHENLDEKLILELRFWASYRGQTLARTVRGMMYNRQALILQSYMETVAAKEDLRMSSTETKEDPATETEEDSATETKKFQFQCEARAYADLKFTYVITCQLYSEQKEKQPPAQAAADIALLLQRNEALRVAFIHVDTSHGQTKFFSKLVKGDINGNEEEVYSIELPGQFKLGEGKPENQNHAIVFTRGNAVQTIDMNQDNYFEETLKMRNLLQEFHKNHGIRPATILGVREHIYTERASSVASFMSKQEISFVTIAQRILGNLLKVRMHYGHPDVFDRVFHITRGGISKASRGINISEDIYAGFNSTLRKGNITHHEYIQVGKGRDVGLHQIATFERKVAGGNGEQVLSRDVYRLGQRFDFFRMLSFYYTSVGYYFYNWLMVITLYIILYGQLITALSGIHVARMFINQKLLAYLLIIYPAIYLILGSLLEQNLEM